MGPRSSYTYEVTFSRARLRGHRQGRQLSQLDLAHAVGLELHEYAAIEAGVTEPDELLVADIALVMGVPRHELMHIAATWAEDYVDAVLGYAAPMTDADVSRAAHALRGAA